MLIYFKSNVNNFMRTRIFYPKSSFIFKKIVKKYKKF